MARPLQAPGHRFPGGGDERYLDRIDQRHRDPAGAQPYLFNFDDIGRQRLWRIQREVLGYPHYTVFDSVSVQIADDAVRLVDRDDVSGRGRRREDTSAGDEHDASRRRYVDDLEAAG